MLFKKIILTEWQQFENVDISFHDRLTVITGANGSGKSTILSILAKHSGWDSHSLATPKKDIVKRVWEWATGFFSDNINHTKIGEIEYSNGTKGEISLPQYSSSAQYDLQIQNRQPVECFFIPSHRSVFRYQLLSEIPTQKTIDKKQAFQKVSDSNKSRYFGGNDQSSSFYMKETLVTWSLFGRGNEDMEPNETMTENFKGFQDILRVVLPKELGFKRFVIKNFEVVLESESGDFLIDASSGGISAIIDMAWQIYMYSTDKKAEFTVLIDEVENHLHPSMQRRILTDFLEAFPQVSFIVSTHSPLIVGSVKESEVYILRFQNNGNMKKVVTQKLDLVNKARTAAEILDEVLGVSFTMPVWAEEKLNEIVGKYLKIELTEDSFGKMRSELSEIGLEKLVPTAITKIVEQKDEKDK